MQRLLATCFGEQRRRPSPASVAGCWSPLLNPADCYYRVRSTCDKYGAEIGFCDWTRALSFLGLT